jgi:hypothetical protein
MSNFFFGRVTRIGLTASRIVVVGNFMLRRAKHSKIEVVAPKEEEEEEEEEEGLPAHPQNPHSIRKHLKKTRTDNQTKFYKVVARPTLLYGSETWVTTKRCMSRLEAAEMRFLRISQSYGTTVVYAVRR